MILEDGDPFEQKYASWIREHLPYYEQIWAAFIGNDGSGTPCPMLGLDSEKEISRQRFCQAHYSFVAMLRIAWDKANLFDEEKSEYTVETMEIAIERFFFMMASVGYVRDMFEKIEYALGIKQESTLSLPLDNLYKQRSNIIHGPRLCGRFEGGLFKIPKLAGATPTEEEWSDKMIWPDASELKHYPIHEVARDLVNDLMAAVKQCHAKVFNAADRHFEKGRISASLSSNPFQSDSDDPPTTIPSGTNYAEDPDSN